MFQLVNMVVDMTDQRLRLQHDNIYQPFSSTGRKQQYNIWKIISTVTEFIKARLHHWELQKIPRVRQQADHTWGLCSNILQMNDYYFKITVRLQHAVCLISIHGLPFKLKLM